jgi:hypothetical protein
MEPDGTLWSRAGSGDAEALGVLFEPHAKTIYDYCFRRIGDWRLRRPGFDRRGDARAETFPRHVTFDPAAACGRPEGKSPAVVFRVRASLVSDERLLSRPRCRLLVAVAC